MLKEMVGFVTTTDPAKTKQFYGEMLGFRLIADDEFAVVFDANGTLLRAARAHGPFTPAQGTVLGWEVADVHASVRELTARGVKFEQFNLPFLKQDADGVWVAPNGDEVAWFKDPDGNVLSLSHHLKR
jgi:catechol 2,3-dioxygenase-like lactoylglutathione lyase family enzyme